VRIGLIGSIAGSLALIWVDNRWAFFVLVLAASVMYGFFWVPGTAILSDGTERARIDLAFGAMLLNLAWAPGDVAGAALGGALGQALGDGAVYLLVAALCVVTLLASRRLAPARPLHSHGSAGAGRPARSASAE
jgi:predicted MFS family arabinose efflux permease